MLIILCLAIVLIFALSLIANISANTREARIISRRRSYSNRQRKTWYYATFEFNDGGRKELVIPGLVYGTLKEGDRGTVRYSGMFYQGFDRKINHRPNSKQANAVNQRSTYNTQSTHTFQQNQDKLQLGLERLSRAGDDLDLLGLALISLHGALEDYFRNWLSTNPSVPPLEREAVLDARQM